MLAPAYAFHRASRSTTGLERPSSERRMSSKPQHPPAVRRWLDANRRALLEQQRRDANRDALRFLGIALLLGLYLLGSWLELHQ